MKVARKVAASVVFVAGALGAARAARAESTEGVLASSASPLVRYQDRLALDAERILAPEVSGTTKSALAAGSLDLATALSVSEWRARLLAKAPALEKASLALVRRTEVIWTEERVADRYDSAVLQLAAVQALTKGLSHVLETLGAPTPPPPAPASAAAPAARPAAEPEPRRAASPAPATAPVAASPRAPSRSAPAPARVAAATEGTSPAPIAAYGATLERESFRVLSPEICGRSLEGVVASRAAMREATTVSAWKAALASASPSLARAGAVLERRAEVLRESHGVADAYESEAVQREAARALQAGLETILHQFGK